MLADVARRVVAEFGPIADRRRAEIAIEEGAGAAASATRTGSRRSCVSSSTNALTHTPEGTAIKVGIQTASDNGSASLLVTDDGPGIDTRSRERVFERFYTGDEVSGSGLGLAIGRELALRMGGSLALNVRRGRTSSSSACERRPGGEVMRARLTALAAVMAVAALVAGCGGSDSTTTVTAAATDSSTTADAHRVVVQAEDGAFDASAIYEAVVPRWSR